MPTADGATPLSTALASTVAFPGGGADAHVTPDHKVAFRVPVDEDGWVVVDPAAAGEFGGLLALLAGAALGHDEACAELEPEVDALREELAVAGGLLTSARPAS